MFTYLELFKIHYWINVPLHGPILRDRNKAVRVIAPVVNEIEKKRHELLDKYVERKKDGDFSKIVDENGLYKMKDGDKEKFEKELNEFLNSETDIKLTKQHKKTLYKILNEHMPSSLAMGIEEGAVYDKILDKLEK